MLNIEKEREAFEERFQHLDLDFVEDLGYCESETQYAWAAWWAATERAEAKLEGCVVVPINNTTIVAVEKMVEQQVEASGITADVFRLDGEKILNAAVEAARGGK